MPDIASITFVVISAAGSACLLLAVRGLIRTKNLGFVLLGCISAPMMLNGLGRIEEYKKIGTLRAIEIPVMLVMLAIAALLFQSSEKKG